EVLIDLGVYQDAGRGLASGDPGANQSNRQGAGAEVGTDDVSVKEIPAHGSSMIGVGGTSLSMRSSSSSISFRSRSAHDPAVAKAASTSTCFADREADVVPARAAGDRWGRVPRGT